MSAQKDKSLVVRPIEKEWPMWSTIRALTMPVNLGLYPAEDSFRRFAAALPYYDLPESILPNTAAQKLDEKGYGGLQYPCEHSFRECNLGASMDMPPGYKLLYRACTDLHASNRIGNHVLSDIRIMLDAKQPLPGDAICFVSLNIGGLSCRCIGMERSADGLHAVALLDWILPVGWIRYAHFYVYVTVAVPDSTAASRAELAPIDAESVALPANDRIYSVTMSSRAMALQQSLLTALGPYHFYVRWPTRQALQWDDTIKLGDRANVYHFGEGLCAPLYTR